MRFRTVVPASGDVVEARGERWLVARRVPYDACAVLTLEGVGAAAGRQLKLIEPFDRVRVVRGRLRQRPRRQVLEAARHAMADTRPVGGLWSAARARITLLPYQLEPALAVLNGATRVLLADAVGLGKTVQAGLILAELRARGLVDRALVLTPAGLRHAWAAELHDRFGLTAVVLDQTAIASQSWLAAAAINPWTCHDIVVSSLDFVKRPDVLDSVEAAPFDLLIADEAHHLSPGSDRAAAVARLSARTPWVILATATPHSGDEPAFTSLTSIGAQNDRLVIFRRTRADAGLPQSRRSRLLAVSPTSDEAAMFGAIDRYTNAIWQTRGADDASVRLVATTLRRRAASSARALRQTLVRRRALLGHDGELAAPQLPLPWEEVDDADADLSDQALSALGLNDLALERGQLDALLALTRSAVTTPSKIRRVRRLLARVREPVLIFTEYRDTLDALAESLTPHYGIAVIHGAMPMEQRRVSVERFTTGLADVLVATDAAGEGLNLHNRCRLVVNMELPWNPLRLEQRVGRVDRIGQSRRVHAIHLFHRDTVEETVLARLERRRMSAALALDDTVSAWSSENDVGAAVFGEAVPDRPPHKPVASMRIAGAASEAERLEILRRCRPDITRDRPIWTPPRSAGQSTQLVCLSTVRHAGAAGLTLDESDEATVLELRHRPANRRAWKQIVQSIERVLTAAPATDIRNRERSDAIERALAPFRHAVQSRLEAIRRSVARSRQRQWQASLFDRRAELDEARRLGSLDLVDAHLARRSATVDGLKPAHEQIHRRLVAAWPLCATSPRPRRTRP